MFCRECRQPFHEEACQRDAATMAASSAQVSCNGESEFFVADFLKVCIYILMRQIEIRIKKAFGKTLS